MAIEWKFNVLSHSIKEIFPETIYLSWQLFYAIFLGKDGIASVFLYNFLSPVIKGIYTR